MHTSCAGIDVHKASVTVCWIGSGAGGDQMLEGSGAIALRGPATATGRDSAETAFILSVPGKIRREFHGRIEVRAAAGHPLAIVTMDRETSRLPAPVPS